MDVPGEALSNILPYPLALLLCDTVIVEAETGKKTLVGLFDRVFARVFPTQQRLAIYAKFTDAEGAYQFRMEYVSISRDRMVGTVDIERMRIPDRLAATELVVRTAVPIPEPGQYEFRLYANGSYLGRLTFEAVLVDQAGGQASGD